jgi:predicted Zn-dependent peptidase
VDAFILGVSWEDYISQTERLSKISKEDIVKFANERFGNNYVISYKRKGEDKNIQKVDKPEITPVNVNRETQSKFLTDLVNTPAPDIEPVFADYKDNIKISQLSNGTPVYYIENTENSTFNLYYVLDFGTNADKRLGLAISYLEYLGTSKYSPSELKQEFYKLGCSFSVSSSDDQVYVSLRGLSDNFEKGLVLFEDFLSDIQPNRDALDNLVNDILKEREDAKLSKDEILWSAMFSYAKYGSLSPFTNRLSETELRSIAPDELIGILMKLKSYPHMVLYYGPLGTESLVSALNSKHIITGEQLPLPLQADFPELPTDENAVYFVNYKDMVQAEIVFLSKCGLYDKAKAPYVSMFNEYFGSGMSGIVFQELRESRALAYAAFSSYSTPQKKENSFYVFAYIGTQADKLSEAMNGTLEILNEMPESEITFAAAKNSLLNQIKTSRTTKASILFDFLAAKKRGLDYDIRKDIYNMVPSLTLNDVKKFQQENVKGRNYAILVLGDKEKIDMKILEKYGKVKELTLEEVFGY